MRRCAVRRKSRDSSEETGQWIQVFNGCIRSEGKTCTVINNIAECVKQLHTFWTLRTEDERGRTLIDRRNLPDGLPQNTCHLFCRCQRMRLVTWDTRRNNDSRVRWLNTGDDYNVP